MKNEFKPAEVRDIIKGELDAAYPGLAITYKTGRDRTTLQTELTIRWKEGPSWSEMRKRIEKYRRRSTEQIAFDIIFRSRLDELGREIE